MHRLRETHLPQFGSTSTQYYATMFYEIITEMESLSWIYCLQLDVDINPCLGCVASSSADCVCGVCIGRSIQQIHAWNEPVHNCMSQSGTGCGGSIRRTILKSTSRGIPRCERTLLGATHHELSLLLLARRDPSRAEFAPSYQARLIIS